jgi:ketosteroid isomerase-like protein
MSQTEKTVRDAYAAFTRGDIPGFLALCTPDITFQVPGDGLLSGTLAKDEFLAKLGPAMQAVGGTFREEIVELVSGVESAAVLVAQQAERDGRLQRWKAVHWWGLRGGKLASFRELLDDAASFERAWHR